MLSSIIAVIGGLILLVWSADRFVIGAAALANNFGVSPLLIGMVILGFGTSAPEIFVGATATLQGNGAVAVGNAVGSNIANIALVLGVAGLISPLAVDSGILRREFPVLMGITALVAFLIYDQQLSRLDGLILLTCTLSMLVWMYTLSKRPHAPDPIESEYSAEVPKDMPTSWASFWTVAGLVTLVISAYILVEGAVNIAQAIGISDLVIGLTIIAIGTSLPEVAVAISAALKKEHEIVLGNVIGSNMFNLLAVLGVSASIHSNELDSVVITRDYPVMVALTILLFITAYGFRGKGRINRVEAGLLVFSYGAYMVWLYQTEVA